MKKVLTLAAVLALTACGEKKAATPAADSTAMMQHDTATTMSHDSTSMSHDTTMARDTTKKP
jgi:predicted small lipoprotein YifL